MKKSLCAFVLFCCGFMLYGQDIITLKNGEEIEAEVQEVGADSIKYTRVGTEKPLYTILKSEVFMIKYAGGDKEIFKDEPAQAAVNTVIAAPPGNFTTGQRWGAFALNSFILPGLGSYVFMHDWVGGSIMLGLSLTGYICTGLGVYNMVTAGEYVSVQYASYPSLYRTEYHRNDKKWRAGIILVSVSSVALMGNFIFNIVRSITYDKPAPKVTRGFDPARLKIALLPGENETDMERVQVSYTFSF